MPVGNSLFPTVSSVPVAGLSVSSRFPCFLFCDFFPDFFLLRLLAGRIFPLGLIEFLRQMDEIMGKRLSFIQSFANPHWTEISLFHMKNLLLLSVEIFSQAFRRRGGKNQEIIENFQRLYDFIKQSKILSARQFPHFDRAFFVRLSFSQQRALSAVRRRALAVVAREKRKGQKMNFKQLAEMTLFAEHRGNWHSLLSRLGLENFSETEARGALRRIFTEARRARKAEKQEIPAIAGWSAAEFTPDEEYSYFFATVNASLIRRVREE